MAKQKASVAGSNSEPAAGNTEGMGASHEVVAAFPREVEIINDTAIPFTIARAYIEPRTSVRVMVGDDDEITRIKTDCEHILSMNEVYAALEVPALRVVDTI
jgi:hypothetical protein